MSKLRQPIPQMADITDPSLVGSWLSPATAGTAQDASRFGNDGTATDVTYDRDGGGIFNGTSSKIGLTNDPELNFSGADKVWTASFWVKPTIVGGSVDAIIHHNPCWQVVITTAGKVLFFVWGPNTTVESTTTLQVGSWYHVTVVVDSTRTGKIYVNGVQEDTMDVTGTVGTPTTGLFFGIRGYASDQNYSGSLEEVAIYNEAKSADWVSHEFAKGVPDSSLVLHVVDNEDLSRFRTTLTFTDAISGGKYITFTNGGIAWASKTFTSYGYWYRTSGWAKYYFYDGTNAYINGVLTGSMPVSIGATGFSGVTADMSDIKLFNTAKSADWIKNYYLMTRNEY